MKIKFSFLAIAVIFVCSLGTAVAQDATSNFPGMTFDAFVKLNPGVVNDATAQKGEYQKSENFGALDGTWTYKFADGVLSSYDWTSSSKEVNQTNFDTHLNTARQMIGRNRKMYGGTTDYKEYNTGFQQPESDSEGYKIISASWLTAQSRISVALEVKKINDKFALVMTEEFTKP